MCCVCVVCGKYPAFCLLLKVCANAVLCGEEFERRSGDLEALESGLATGGLVLHHRADGAPHHARGSTEVEGTTVGVGVLPLLEDGHEEQLVADEAVRRAGTKKIKPFVTVSSLYTKR
jgi:hypothetical protein